MNITFLGTGSAYPSPNRAASAIILHHLNSGIQWLFDCAEGTQIQIQKIKDVKFKKISKIFITHLHGDHVFGLPGLLSTMAPKESDDIHVDIYGPMGLKKMLRTIIGLSHHDLSFKYCVHEIDIDPKYHPSGWKPRVPLLCADAPLPCEVDGDTIQVTYDLDGNAAWKLFHDACSAATVWAVPLRHTVPCLGFLVLGDDRPGRLDVEKAVLLGVPRGPQMGLLKNGQNVLTPAGATVYAAMVTEAARRGMSVAVMGDSSDSGALATLLDRDDLGGGRRWTAIDYLVHEATLQNGLEESCLHKGHSTPRMAADIAQRVNAGTLILTHFSQRYVDGDGDDSEGEKDSVSILREEILGQGLFSGNVLLARDLMTFELK